MEFKYQINVQYKEEFANFLISSNSNLEKLIKIIEIYFEGLGDKKYKIFLNDISLMDFNFHTLIGEVFSKNCTQEFLSQTIKKSEISGGKIINLVVKELGGNNDDHLLEFECYWKTISKNFKISSKLNFQNFKFNILVLFPEFEEENYSIIYENYDITNFYNENKLLSEIFSKIKGGKSKTIHSQSNFHTQSGKINIFIDIKPKKIVEYHKRCSLCITKKSVYICRRCGNCLCQNCYREDSHYDEKLINFKLIEDFKNYEEEKLIEYLDDLKNYQIDNKNLNSSEFTKIMQEKLASMENKFTEIVDTITMIKNIQVNNLKNIIDLVKNKFKPEDLGKLINSLENLILEYKLEPYYDCQESMLKLIEFGKMLNIFQNDYSDYKLNFKDLNNKFLQFLIVNNSILESLSKKNLIETNSILKKKVPPIVNKFYPIMKVLDSKSILVYDHNSTEFLVMNFNDNDSKFSENFTNYVQINFTCTDSGISRLFIITGNPCQKLFCYNYATNEMELLGILKFSHNWWPALTICKNNDKSKINIFCLSGTYTNKCEQLTLSVINKKLESKTDKDTDKDKDAHPKLKNNFMEWKEMPSMNNAHGQASAFVLNEEIIYVLFGYDFNFSSIATVERYTNTWEVVSFKNPHNISSILYYHSNLLVNSSISNSNERKCYILGGLKDVDENDVVYHLDFVNLNLNKTNYKFDFKDVHFSNEKNFLLLNKIQTSQVNQMTDNNINNINEDSIFSLFDNKNNVIIIANKEDKIEYNIKIFNK